MLCVIPGFKYRCLFCIPKKCTKGEERKHSEKRGQCDRNEKKEIRIENIIIFTIF